MVYLGIFDTSGLTYADLCEQLSDKERERLDNKGSEEYKVNSAAGRVLSEELYRHLFHKPSRGVTLSPLGAPSFLGEETSLSISHSGRLVAVAIADAGECVGIDLECIERENTHPLREDVLRRRLRLPTVTACLPLPDLFVAERSLGGITLRRKKDTTTRKEFVSCGSFLRDYTALEAVMKGEGKGFSAITELSDIYPHYELHIGVFRDVSKVPYVVTIAVKKDNK